MKKLLFTLSLLGAFAASADEIDASAQIFGCLPITSSATNLIVSVPWVAATNGVTNAIAVAEIIKTANLTENDWIRSWNPNSTNFNVWVLKKDSNNILYWEATKTVSTNGTQQTSDSTATFLKRGEALILHRQNPGTSASPNTFYVYGQYRGLTASDETQIMKGSTNAPAYTLIAPPKTVSVNLNDDVTWVGTPDKEDLLFYGTDSSMGKTYQYNVTKGKWGYARGKSTWVDPVIPAGIGLWYVSRGGSPKIKWVKE